MKIWKKRGQAQILNFDNALRHRWINQRVRAGNEGVRTALEIGIGMADDGLGNFTTSGKIDKNNEKQQQNPGIIKKFFPFFPFGTSQENDEYGGIKQARQACQRREAIAQGSGQVAPSGLRGGKRKGKQDKKGDIEPAKIGKNRMPGKAEKGYQAKNCQQDAPTPG